MKDTFGSAIRCDSCDTTFSGNVKHNCTVTRAEFEALRADVRTVAQYLVAQRHASDDPEAAADARWHMMDVRRIAKEPE